MLLLNFLFILKSIYLYISFNIIHFLKIITYKKFDKKKL